MAVFAPYIFPYAPVRGKFGFSGFGGDFVAGGWAGARFQGFLTLSAGGEGEFGFGGFGGDMVAGGHGSFSGDATGSAESMAPTVGIGGADVAFVPSAVTFQRHWSQVQSDVGFRSFGGDFEAGGWGRFAFEGVGAEETIAEQNPLWLLAGTGVLYMTTGFQRSTAISMFSLSQDEDTQPIYVLGSTATLGSAPTTVLEALNSITDNATFVDAMAAIFQALIQEGLDLSTDSTASALLTVELIDSLMLASEPGTALECKNIVAEALALQDVLGILAKEQLSDEVLFTTTFNQQLTARHTAIDSMLLATTDNNTAVLTLVAEDSVAMNATPASVLEAFNTLSDSISFALTFRLGDGVYTAWVCNTESKAFSNYENYPFTSFFEMGGSYYGVAPDGIYQLEGDDDDGTAISARIRTGLWNLGTGKFKRIPSLYLGYRASGDMVLKVITTSDDGEKTENWYRLVTTAANVTREGRIKIGRGMKSVYWGFELENIDGADFALKDLQLFPMILDRRIHGGSNNGN